MSYLETYFSRVNHLGETTAEKIRNGGIRSFEKWKEESPHTVRGLSVERGLYFDGIILTNKDKEYSKIMFLNVGNDIPLVIGDIMTWQQDNNTEEKWLLFQEEKKVNGTYRTFWMVRCNYLIKWIDKLGHIQQSWSYIVSSVDSKIKGNFRTWNSLITPQPNKYAEILMPRYEIDRATNFIVEDESWSVIEYDHTSVPGVVYLSLTEGKINSIYDDLNNKVADTDRLAKYGILAPSEVQNFELNDIINPMFTLTKNGKPFTAEVNLLPTNKNIAKIVDGQLKAVGQGTTQILVQLKDFPSVFTMLTITVGEESNQTLAYIEGPSKIVLDRKGTFIFKVEEDNDTLQDVTFSLNNNLATIIEIKDNYTCIVHANNKNLLGDCILSAVYNGNTYNKTFSIVPLW